MMTSEPTKESAERQTSLPGDFHASLSVVPGSAEARQMTVGSGRKWLALLAKSGPAGCLVRMCLDSSEWASTACWLTWKLLGTKCGRLLFQLAASRQIKGAYASGLWPTLTARDASGRGYQRSNGKNHVTTTGAARIAEGLDYHRGPPLNPLFAEWLMGFPLGWTDLEPSETPLCPR
jgi:hypothetical protein